MPVIFNAPPINFNPILPNAFSSSLSIPGIYIYGLKLPIENFKELFIPFYVGIAENLRTRLSQHYREEKTNGNSRKEVFNLCDVKTIHDINRLYCDMRLYDDYAMTDPLNSIRLSIGSLIWFNSNIFFDSKLKLPKGTSKYQANLGHLSSIKYGGDLDMIAKTYPKSKAASLKTAIVCTKQLFQDNFYFLYAELDKIVGNVRAGIKGSIDPKESVFSNPFFTSYGYKQAWKDEEGTINVGKMLAERIEYAVKLLWEKYILIQ